MTPEIPFWQILTSAGLGALITAASSIIILLITQRQTRNLAERSREHERDMRRIEHDREDAREFSGIIQELTIVTEQWATAQRVIGPLVAKMDQKNLMEWVDTDSGRESRERSVRIGDLLIRALMLARDDEMRQRVIAATEARDAISKAQDDDPIELIRAQFKAISTFEATVSAIAYLVSQRQMDSKPSTPDAPVVQPRCV